MAIRAALELRVHGVHGTSPSSMLGVKGPEQVAGDGITGVFRADQPLPRRELQPGHAVEAYSWGALTSAVKGALGWVQRVLWLGLLPFALVNLAYWSRLHVSDADGRGRWGATMVRWAALLLTMMIVLTGCFISVDLVAWQCYRGGTKSCDVLPGALDFMMFLAPSQRLAVAALVPLAGIGVMWFLSRQSLARYEACSDSREMAGGGTHLLQDPRFWSSTRRTLRLQRIHLAGAIATVMAYVGAQVDRLAGRPGWWTLAAIVILLVAFGALARAHPQDLEHRGTDEDERSPDHWAAHFLRLSALAVVVQLGWLASPWAGERSLEWDSSAGWYGHNLWFIGVFVTLSVVNIAVFAAGRLSRVGSWLVIGLFVTAAAFATWLSLGAEGERTGAEVRPILLVTGSFTLVFFLLMLVWQLRQRRHHPQEAWNGGAAAVLIGAAGWIALLFTTAAVTATADYLNGPDQSVSDLTSAQRSVGDTPAPDEVANADPDLVVMLSEEAVLRDAVVVMAASGPQVVSGDVEVGTAELAGGSLHRVLPTPSYAAGRWCSRATRCCSSTPAGSTPTSRCPTPATPRRLASSRAPRSPSPGIPSPSRPTAGSGSRSRARPPPRSWSRRCSSGHRWCRCSGRCWPPSSPSPARCGSSAASAPTSRRTSSRTGCRRSRAWTCDASGCGRRTPTGPSG
jgi:hypothetical protein